MASFNHHLYFKKQKQSHSGTSWQLRVEAFHRGFSCGIQKLLPDSCAATEGDTGSTRGPEAVENCQRHGCHQLLLEGLCRAGHASLLRGC